MTRDTRIAAVLLVKAQSASELRANATSDPPTRAILKRSAVELDAEASVVDAAHRAAAIVAENDLGESVI